MLIIARFPSISGLNYVATAVAGSSRPSVASLSLGGGISTALDNAATSVRIDLFARWIGQGLTSCFNFAYSSSILAFLLLYVVHPSLTLRSSLLTISTFTRLLLRTGGPMLPTRPLLVLLLWSLSLPPPIQIPYILALTMVLRLTYLLLELTSSALRHLVTLCVYIYTFNIVPLVKLITLI